MGSGAEDFERLLAATVRIVERSGVRGQDAEFIATDLLAKAMLGGRRGALERPPTRLEVDHAVKDFLKGEARRRSRQAAVARPEVGEAETPDPEAAAMLRSVKRLGRRAAVRALRRFRDATDPNDLRAFAHALLGRTLADIAHLLGSSRSTWSRKLIVVRARFQAEMEAEAVGDAALQDLIGLDRLLRRVALAWARRARREEQ